jgi:hypothetical protein
MRLHSKISASNSLSVTIHSKSAILRTMRATLGGVLRRLLEVGAHALAQVDRFADIQHRALRVLKEVAARLLRQRLEFRLEGFGHRANCTSCQRPSIPRFA